LIVGGGTLAGQKVRSLLPSGARIVLVAPEISEACLAEAAAGRITVVRREFTPEDLDGAELAFAATDSPEINHRVVELARLRGIPANAVDDPAFCDFYTPAVVRRGMVNVAISTDGRFPGLTRVLREVLEEWLPAENDGLLEALERLRAELRQSRLSPAERGQVLRDLIAQTRDRYLRAARGSETPPSPEWAEVRREGTLYDYFIS
jgi:precorrin-2 dehydrogenase/sirohydrochlorin ferrochelatase